MKRQYNKEELLIDFLFYLSDNDYITDYDWSFETIINQFLKRDKIISTSSEIDSE